MAVTDGTVELIRGKAWIPDELLSMSMANRTDSRVKLFAAPMTSEVTNLEKGFAPGAMGGERSLSKGVVVTDEELNDKFIRPILARLSPELARELPSLLQAVQGSQKTVLPQDVVNDPDVSEKLGALLGGIIRPICRCLPRVITAMGGRVTSGPSATKDLDSSDLPTLDKLFEPLD